MYVSCGVAPLWLFARALLLSWISHKAVTRIANPSIESSYLMGPTRFMPLPELRLAPRGGEQKSFCMSTTRRAGLEAMIEKRGKGNVAPKGGFLIDSRDAMRREDAEINNLERG